MKFFTLSYVAALLAYGAVAQKETSNIPSALEDPTKFLNPSAHGWPLNEVGTGSQMVRILYPGYDATMKEDDLKDRSLRINFYKWSAKPSAGGKASIIPGAGGDVIHQNISKPWAFSFAVPSAEVIDKQWYSVQFCVDKQGDEKSNSPCSPLSEPATMMDTGSGNTLSCPDYPNMGIPDINELAQQTEVDMLKTIKGTKANKIGATSPLEWYYDGQEMTNYIYAAVRYDMGNFKDALSNPDTDKVTVCRRKYFMSMLVHIMKKDTLQVMGRYRVSPFLSDHVLDDYVKQDKQVPIEILMKVDSGLRTKLESKPEDYELRFTTCFDENDQIDTVKCSAPFNKQIDEILTVE